MLEINLVKCQGPFNPVYTLIARTRIVAEDDGAVMDAAMNFLKANSDTLTAAIADTDLIAKIMNAKGILLDEFMSLKYILTQHGLDVLVNTVAELEVGADGIDDNINEYNVIDIQSDGLAKRTTKVLTPADQSSMSEVYSKICDLYNYFNGPISSGYNNPMTVQLQQLKRMEDAVGVGSTQITSYLNSILEYMGKNIILISNE